MKKNSSKRRHIIEAETAAAIGGSKKVSDNLASGNYLAGLNKTGDGILFSNLPPSQKLAIRYASVNVGTISIALNNRKVIKVNVHSSGAVTHSFLQAIIPATIPAGARLKIYLDSNDVALKVDQILVGNDDLGLALTAGLDAVRPEKKLKQKNQGNINFTFCQFQMYVAQTIFIFFTPWVGVSKHFCMRANSA